MLVVTLSPSEIQFAVYASETPLMPVFDGDIERVGTKNTAFRFTDNFTKRTNNFCFFSTDYSDAVSFMLGVLEKQKSFIGVKTARFTMAINDKTMALKNTSIASLYNLKNKALHTNQYTPDESKLKELLRQRCPGLKQITFCDSVAASSFPEFYIIGNMTLQPQA